ncbi:MAG: hypothetical protein MUQ00_06955, partial [Candidatus Aminicenantes bacterium]|nr:hypothetical protein [Candidatus Aminicenantes bacterium]
TPEGLGPVDFRSLGVREFGTIYEGLLENELSLAQDDLTVDKDGVYRPLRKKGDEVIVPKCRPYLHNSSGARKSSGSYFTPDFAVEHLLDYALEPALKDHIARLAAIKDDKEAAKAFFDFRVADIAMGSGHFLVSAVDRIESELSKYLFCRRLAPVFEEIGRLREKAITALGSAVEDVVIEDNRLLRRQIARRCIFGVDLNPLAVQLARLSIWIHTFVPGLPLSFLDHNLIEGNSLVGIATVKEAEEELREFMRSLFSLKAEELVGSAREALAILAASSDADASEIELARKASREAREAVLPAEALFDILSAARINEDIEREVQSWPSLSLNDLEALPKNALYEKAKKCQAALRPLHFPVVFPEVFLRDRGGFDVIIGNPPWEETTVEEDRFWTRFVPGFHSLPQHEQESMKRTLRRERTDLVSLYESELARASAMRTALTAGPFPGMGTGDPDLYKAFAWRFWQLASPQGGRIGVVLPRTAFSAKGLKEFRFNLLSQGIFEDLTTLLNSGGWVFSDAEPRYTISLVALKKQKPDDNALIPMRGPYRNESRYKAGVAASPPRYKVKDVLSWTDTAALPLLPDDASGEVFAQLRKSPRLDLDDKKSWFARPYRELDATIDKPLMTVVKKRPEGFWPVFKGESFDIWTPDTGSYYAWGDPDKMLDALQQKRLRARTSFSGFSAVWLNNPKTLPCLKPRVAFRDVSRATDSRTVRACLVPAKVFLTNTAPYLIWPRGDEKDQAFLLGTLSSLPLDWYSRRFVEIHVNYFIFNTLPVPRPTRSNVFWKRSVYLAGRLAAADKRFFGWAEAVGVECGRLEEDEKDVLIHELDAVTAHHYGLSEKQLIHIYETFHEGWDYEDRLKEVLKHFTAWSRKK